MAVVVWETRHGEGDLPVHDRRVVAVEFAEVDVEERAAVEASRRGGMDRRSLKSSR